MDQSYKDKIKKDRLNALKCAARCTKIRNSGTGFQTDIDRVLRVAESFQRWINE